VRIGYELLIFSDVATEPGQLRTINAATHSFPTNNSNGLFYQGGTLGFQANW